MTETDVNDKNGLIDTDLKVKQKKNAFRNERHLSILLNVISDEELLLLLSLERFEE